MLLRHLGVAFSHLRLRPRRRQLHLDHRPRLEKNDPFPFPITGISTDSRICSRRNLVFKFLPLLSSLERRGPIVHGAGSKKDWVLTPTAFDQLLSWLDQGNASGGEKYLEMRRRLVAYFSRKNCPTPDDLADETLNRLARRLEEEGAIDTIEPGHYCYVVARFVLLEFFRKTKSQSLEDLTLLARADTLDRASSESIEHEEQERRWQCFQQCMANISSESRELIISYYYGDQGAKIKNRRLLAAKLGITINALSIRAWRIRNKLEACVKRCVGQSEMFS